MAVTIPEARVDPASLRAALGPLTHAAAVVAAQADTTARAWLGLTGVYDAEEAARLFAALDPVRADAEVHQHRIAGVGAALDELATVADPIVRQLDELRVQAATAPPEDEARILNEAQALLGALDAAEATCAADIRAAVEQRYNPSVDEFNRGINGPLGAGVLQLGDATRGLGLIDSPLEDGFVRHFTDGTGTPYVFSRAELAALAADPTVRRAVAEFRPGGTGRAVTLEGGRPGHAVDVAFADPVAGRSGVNPYDGSLGKATLYLDEHGTFVGLSDVNDFTNDNPSVDQVNILGSAVGARPFHVRAGVIEQQPYEEFLPKEPDAAEALERLRTRSPDHQLGPVPLVPRPR